MVKKNWLLLIILFLSLLLHLIKLGSQPTFIADEVSIGYNAYSILKTGRDEWGKFLPISFKAFGEYKLPLYIYFSVLPILVLGLNEFSTRLISALFGVLSGYLVYLLVDYSNPKNKKSQIFPILVAYLFVINPWHLQISRMAIEANLALSFFLLGLVFFQRGKLSQAMIAFALTFYTYNAFRVFIPLFFVFNFIFKKTDWHYFKKPILVFLVIISPLVITGFKGSGERMFKTSIFNDPGVVLRVQENRIRCQLQFGPTFCRLVFNRPTAYASEISRNYLSHFSPSFLIHGPGLAQYALPNFGVIYYFQLPFLVFGFWQIFKQKALSEKIIPWLIAAPVATSVTGPAHPLRSLVFMPILSIISGLGIIFIIDRVKKGKIIFLAITFGLAFFSLINFLNQYFRFYPTQTGSIWQSGYRSLYQYLAKKETGFREIRVTKFYGEPHIFYLFYRQINPLQFQTDKAVNRYDRPDHWVNVDQIGKYLFFEKPDLETAGLLVLAAYESQPNLRVKEKILFVNKETAFNIYEIE